MPYRDFLYACLGGVLLGVGFIVPALWFFAFVGFTPLLYVLWHREVSLPKAFVLGLLTGLIGYGLSFYTNFWDTLPLAWLGIGEAWVGWLVVGAIWLLTVLVFSIGAGLFALVVRWLRTDTFSDVFVAAAAWPLADWGGAWLFYLFNFDPNMLPGPHFSIGSFAYQLASEGALLQAAWLGGLYALDILMVFVGALLARSFVTTSRSGRYAIFLIGAFTLCPLSIGHLVLARIPSDAQAVSRAFDVAIIPTNREAQIHLTPQEQAQRFEDVSSRLGIVQKADFILLPEGTNYLESLHVSHGSLSGVLSEELMSQEDGPLMIDSGVVRTPGGYFISRTEYRDLHTWTSEYRYKEFLAPFGEVLPRMYYPLAYMLGQEDVLRSFLEAQSFERPIDVQHPVSFEGVSVVALMCSDGMSPTLYARKTRLGADILFNITSQSWFHSSPRMDALVIKIAKVRAVENRRWLAVAADEGTSFVLDPHGRIKASASPSSTGVLETQVYARKDLTPYSMFGEWVLLVPLVIFGFFVWHRRTIAPRRTSA